MGFNLMQLSFGKGWQGDNAYLAYLLGEYVVCWAAVRTFCTHRGAVKKEYIATPKILCGLTEGEKALARKIYTFYESVALKHFVPPKALCLRQVGRLTQLFLAGRKPSWDLQALWEVTSRKGNSLCGPWKFKSIFLHSITVDTVGFNIISIHGFQKYSSLIHKS